MNISSHTRFEDFMVVKIHVVVVWILIQFICLVHNNILEKYYTSIFRNNDYVTQLAKRSHYELAAYLNPTCLNFCV